MGSRIVFLMLLAVWLAGCVSETECVKREGLAANNSTATAATKCAMEVAQVEAARDACLAANAPATRAEHIESGKIAALFLHCSTGADPMKVPVNWTFLTASTYDDEIAKMREVAEVLGEHGLLLDYVAAGVSFGDMETPCDVNCMKLWYAPGGPADKMANGVLPDRGALGPPRDAPVAEERPSDGPQ